MYNARAHMPTHSHIAAAAFAIMTGGLVIGGACVEENLNPQRPGDAGGAGGVGGGTGGMGTGGEGLPDRGDLSDFPQTCTMSCEEACANLDACGAAESASFGIGTDLCLQLCEVAQGGPFWGDISANFKCCASQDDCSAVKHCGGWLNHPATQPSCQRLCACFTGGAEIASVFEGHVAPAPYHFAEHAVVVALPSERAAMPTVPNVRMQRSGQYVRAHFGEGSGMHTLAQLSSAGKILPSFVDNAGRVSGATGRVYVRAPSVAKRALARSITVLRAGSAPTKVSHSRTLYTSQYADPWDAVDAVNEMRAAGLDAELDMVREHKLHYTPNDPLFPEQWHLRNVGQGVSMSGVDTRVNEAWDITLGDPQVLIAINDDGVDLNHPDFAGRLDSPLNYPADWEALMEAGSFAGHGTAVAGVAVASADNLAGGVGACPGCRVLPHLLALADASGSFQVSDEDTAKGFERQIAAGAWVINNSWGLGLGDPLYADADMPSPIIPNVIKDVYDFAETDGRAGLGTVIVFAAGNENTITDYHSNYATTVSVAAIGDLGLKAYYSCLGPSITIATPSSGALTGITTTGANGTYTFSFGGTSSASPLATGILGLIFSANPTLTAAQARDILTASATVIDPVFGAYDASGHSDFYGAGMANAYVAVRMAEGTCTLAADCPAPSDDCGASCGSRTACAPCRTQADCAPDHACQALPSVGRMVCVADKPAAGGCPEGSNEVNGSCLPLAETCGACLGGEACNGRDDDCNGETDEGDACGSGAPRCFIDSLPCPEDTVCAAISCVDTCETDDDCGGGTFCRTVKDPYGNVSGAKGCVVDQSGAGCQLGCAVLASSLDDEALQSFRMCMMDGTAECQTAQACAALLPVEF